MEDETVNGPVPLVLATRHYLSLASDDCGGAELRFVDAGGVPVPGGRLVRVTPECGKLRVTAIPGVWKGLPVELDNRDCVVVHSHWNAAPPDCVCSE